MRARALLLLVLVLAPLQGAAGEQPARSLDAPRDLIVLLEGDASLPPLAFAHVPLRVVNGFVVLDAPPETADALARLPGVARVDAAVPLEFHQAAVGHAQSAAAGARDLNLRLTRADEVELGGTGVTVAVVDSGIDATHPDLHGRVKENVRLAEGEFLPLPGDTDGHGTHVAGIIAGSGASSGGRHRGVAPGAELVGIDISGHFTTASALLAYDWLFIHREALGIDVVVNAWGRVGREAFDPGDAVVRAIDRLTAEGVVVLFSASNHGPAPGTLSLEAQHPRVITVGAVDAAARLMEYSSRGPVRVTRGDAWVKPDVMAPGEGVVAPRSLQSAARNDDPDALHTTMSGTSQSVPHVAGIVALMLQANRSLTPTQVANALRASAIDLGEAGPDDASGFGLVDAPDAVRQAKGLPNTRGNVLIAGGIDAYQDEGVAAPAARSAPALLGLRPLAQEAWRTDFVVKPGANLLTFDLRWTMPRVAPRVLIEADGATVGTWTRAEASGDYTGAVVVRGRLDAPAPGTYTLRVEAAAPAPVEVGATVDVHLRANVSRALELDSRYRLPEPTPAGTDALLGWLRERPAAIPLGGSMLLLALALRSPRRRSPVADAPLAAPQDEPGAMDDSHSIEE